MLFCSVCHCRRVVCAVLRYRRFNEKKRKFTATRATAWGVPPLSREYRCFRSKEVLSAVGFVATTP